MGAKETPLDFAAPVRSAVSAVRKELDDLIRSLDKSYGEASQVSPAFQWAQNSTHIFFQVKFAQRWNAPGALEVENTSITISDCCFAFKGFGEHSMIRKEYKLFLQFLESVVEPPASSWHFAAAGRLVVSILKKKKRVWERLLKSEHKPENMGVWRDMQEKWKADLAAQDDIKTRLSNNVADDGEDDADEEEESKCAAGSFADSKVREFCPENMPLDSLKNKQSKRAVWSVLYYVPESTTMKKSLSPVWRALADVAPSHNKQAAVAAVDCSKHTGFCEKMGMQLASLPAAVRYAPAESQEAAMAAGVSYEGDFVLEDLAAWAAAADTGEPKEEKKL